MISEKKIIDDLINFLKKGNPLISKNVSKDKSLVDLGIIDSFGIIEIIEYFEKKYKIQIENDEINKNNFGSLNLMSKIVIKKIYSNEK